MIGAFYSAKFSCMKRNKFSKYWNKILTVPTMGLRMLMGFVGGFLLLMGANLAGGCTTGNGISGMALLSIGSYIVIISMFLAALITVRFYIFKKG